jgi:protein-glutamine gamma-glutamyltransferase
LLFWGVMTGRIIVAIPLAVLIECAYWTKLRWDFDETATSRAWQISTLGTAILSASLFIDTNLYAALPAVLTWTPALLFPMQFVQSFGIKTSLPLSAFSFFAKKRRERDRRLGLIEDYTYINFGNAYFISIIVASTLGEHAGWWPFLPSVILLTGWLLFSSSRARPVSLAIALVVAGGLAVAGEMGIDKLKRTLLHYGNSDDLTAQNSKTTRIGTPGKIKLSRNILWRLSTENNSNPPKLLRTASYNSYNYGTWRVIIPNGVEFKSLDTRLFETVPYYLFSSGQPESAQIKSIADPHPSFRLRGSVTEKTPMPLPGDPASMRDFELDDVERDQFGTVRLFPSSSVIDGLVLWGADKDSEISPVSPNDLVVPGSERKAVEVVLKELKIEELGSLDKKLQVIRQYFQTDFSYTLEPTIRKSIYDRKDTSSSAISQFLTTNRAGHCEYFASATTFILRGAGIPTRYVSGYAVREKNKAQQYSIRESHSHAWCRVWDQKTRRWIDFDTTPPSWLEAASDDTSFLQSFKDAVQRIREDFFLWRNKLSNQLKISIITAITGLSLIAFIAYRLWRSKHQVITSKKSILFEGDVIQTPLNAIEQKVAKYLGPRPIGQPFPTWLMRLKIDTSVLDEAISIHQRLRFDPAPHAQTEQDRLAMLVKKIESEIKSLEARS